MRIFDKKLKKVFCDLQCYACEGSFLPVCLLAKTGMKFAAMDCMAEGKLLEIPPNKDSLWEEFNIIDYTNDDSVKFPNYRGEHEH